jgi:hypothetical protein
MVIELAITAMMQMAKDVNFVIMSLVLNMLFLFFLIAGNVLYLPVGSDFEAIYRQPSTNFDKGTTLDLSTESLVLLNLQIA